jgi:hypothetical protein
MQNSAKISFVANGAQIVPVDNPRDAAVWRQIALSNDAWSLETKNNQIDLSRQTTIDGKQHNASRVYWRAPTGAAGALFLYSFHYSLSIGQAFCGLSALSNDQRSWDKFFSRIILMQPVLAEIRRLDALGGQRSLEEQLRMITLASGPQSLGDKARPVEDLPADARKAVVDHSDATAAMSSQPDAGWLRTIAFLGSPAQVSAEAACLAKAGG